MAEPPGLTYGRSTPTAARETLGLSTDAVPPPPAGRVTMRRIAPWAAAFLLISSASSQHLFVTTAEVDPSILSIDPASGSVLASIPITGQGALFGGITFDGASLLTIEDDPGAQSSRLFQIAPATGAGTGLGSIGSFWNVRSIERNPVDGTLWATNDNDLYRVDPTTGAVTFVATIAGPTLDTVQGIAIDASEKGWAVDFGGDGLFTFDLATGVATHVGNLNQPGFLFAFRDLAFDADGTLWAVGTPGPGGLYSIDPAGPTATNVVRGEGFAGVAFADVDCAGSSYCSAKVSQNGCVAKIAGFGEASASAGSGFFVRVREMTPVVPGLFFYSTAGPAALPFYGGALCVAPPVRRFPATLHGGFFGMPCSGVLAIDLNQEIASGAYPELAPNATVYVQYWYFDQGNPDGTNVGLSPGYRFWICP